jgi:glycosyltransferase involved in cell wall biosynthesis
MNRRYDISIIGTVGLPAAYGGFETLAEQLTLRLSSRHRIQVFCSGRKYPVGTSRPQHSGAADLCYVEWDANGWQSIPYDFVSLWRSARDTRTLLVLGVSGGLLLPVIRLFWPTTRIVTNVDGLEWKRRKWGHVARLVLRISEWAAVRFSHAVVADNQGILDHIALTYRRDSYLIAYGGDQASTAPKAQSSPDTRFEDGTYYLAVCRIEPENNIAEMLEAFATTPQAPIVLIGNWSGSPFAKNLRLRFGQFANIELKDPIYDAARLYLLRRGAKAYVHGHSAGGTNPSLVEAMYAGMAVLAYDVDYNRHTTGNQAMYWANVFALIECLQNASVEALRNNADAMARIAQQQYTWAGVAAQYEAVLFASF